MAVIFILCMSLLASPLAATTVQRFDLAALSANAERIVVGVCSRAEPQLVGGQIYTRYLFSIDQSIKGSAVSQLELYLPGGRLQGVFTHIAGMPVFTRGEEAVLFLTGENELGHAWPVGLAQGRFAIVRDEPDNPRIYQELDGLTLHSAPGAPKKAPVVDPVRGMPLDLFLSRIRTLSQSSVEQRDAH